MHSISKPIMPSNIEIKFEKKFKLSEFFKGFKLFSNKKIYSEMTIQRK